jgi:hypothetical protein
MDGGAADDRKIVFGLIRELWIALANERASMSPEELAQEVAAMARIAFSGKPL